MPRPRLSVAQVLEQIESAAGPRTRKLGERVVDLATAVGAQPRPRKRGIALRLPGPVNGKPDWLTLFVLSTKGTLYNNWHDRWASAGVSQVTVSRYESAMIRILGSRFVSSPKAYSTAPELGVLRGKWPQFERAIVSASRSVQRAVNAKSHRFQMNPSWNESLSAIEGQMTEVKVARRRRSASLRRHAIAQSRGTCEACGVNFGVLLGGRGWRVLQVHHKLQLSALDTPTWNGIEDLAVVCANCHLLIHADPTSALPIATLRGLLHRQSAGLSR